MQEKDSGKAKSVLSSFMKYIASLSKQDIAMDLGGGLVRKQSFYGLGENLLSIISGESV